MCVNCRKLSYFHLNSKKVGKHIFFFDIFIKDKSNFTPKEVINMKKRKMHIMVNAKNTGSKIVTIILPKNQNVIVHTPCTERTSFGGYDFEKSNTTGIYLAK